MELSKVPLNICSLSTYGTFTPASKCSWELKWLLPCGTCASNLCNFSYEGYLQKWLSQQTLIIKHSHLCQQFRLIQHVSAVPSYHVVGCYITDELHISDVILQGAIFHHYSNFGMQCVADNSAAIAVCCS